MDTKNYGDKCTNTSVHLYIEISYLGILNNDPNINNYDYQGNHIPDNYSVYGVLPSIPRLAYVSEVTAVKTDFFVWEMTVVHSLSKCRNKS